METLRYVGGAGPGLVEVPGCGKVRRGGTIDVPDETAEMLLKRGGPANWEPAIKVKAKSGKTEKPAADGGSEPAEGKE